MNASVLDEITAALGEQRSLLAAPLPDFWGEDYSSCDESDTSSDVYWDAMNTTPFQPDESYASSNVSSDSRSTIPYSPFRVSPEVSLEEDSCDWDLASVATLSTVSVMVVVLLTW